MSEKFISSIHIQKLGHNLLEIRERALQNIISKLDHGFVYDNDLARSKEILAKLFEWFLFEPCSKEDVVLLLIKRIFQTESGNLLIQHYGTEGIITELRQIRSCVEPKYFQLVDDIIKYLQENKQPERNHVPPLQSELPLSYRTEDGIESDKRFTSKSYGTTASSIRGYVRQDTSEDQRTARPASESKGVDSLKNSQTSEFSMEACLPFFHLSWQPLVAPDRHVLESIEQSLRNPPQPASLLHSCEFFTDVMLQDFPAEVFIQRPSIVSLFLNLLSKSTSTRLTAGILTCFQKLTNCLIKRICYYSDPCTHNLKQNVVVQMFSDVSTPSSLNHNSERSDPPSLGSRSTSSSENEKFEDTVLLKTKQLSLPNYCITLLTHVLEYLSIKPQLFVPKNKIKYQVGYNISLDLVKKLVILLNSCMKIEIWNHGGTAVALDVLNKFNEALIKFGDALEYYRLEVNSSDCDKFNRVIHLCLLHNCIDLLEKQMPQNKMDFILPRNLKNALANSILDSTFSRLYPSTHESLLKIVKDFGGRYETDSLRKHDDVRSICSSITAAVKFVKKSKSLPTIEALMLAVEGVGSLEFHKNLVFVKNVVEICANKLPQHNFSESILKTIDDVNLALLAHTDTDIREYMYQQCKKRIVAAIGPKLNTSKTGAPGSQVQFLLRSEIILEIIVHGLGSENKEIRECSEDIVIHILKCRILVSESIWNLVVIALIPVFPMLMCYANKQTTLGRSIMNIFDPDVAQTLLIPQAEVLKANIALLFSHDSLAREEAVSRLCWILSSDRNAKDMLPRLNNLSDKALSVICQLQHTIDFNKQRGPQQFYQPSSVQQVLELLNSPNVEPVIRRSALTQISVMMEDPLIHITFLEYDGVEIILNAMKTALIETDYQDYPDSLIPGIAIFKHLCMYNTSARQELSNRKELYNYALRGMFLFCTEERVKQDGSILLFLLLYGNVLLGSPTKADLSMPKLVREKLIVPFSGNTHWLTSKNSPPGLKSTLASNVWCLSSIQIHWNSEWYGGFKELLKWDVIDYEEDISKFDKLMRLSNNDLFALKNSNWKYCLEKELNCIQNAVSHEVVLESIGNLIAYLQLYVLVDDTEANDVDIMNFPWEESFVRFLNTVPSGEEDVILLSAVIKFLQLLVPLYKVSGNRNWISQLLKDPCCILFVLLQSEVTNPNSKTLNRDILILITDCVQTEQHFIDYHNIPNISVKETGASWSHVIEIISENLQFNETQHFYNLAYLNCLLSCLVHLSAALDWSNSKAGSAPKDLLVQLVSGLCDLVGAFHCSKGPTAPATLMGISITRHVVLVLNHLLAEMQYTNTKGWDVCFLEEDFNGQKSISSLCALWLSRDVVLRAAVLQLFSGLALSPHAATLLINEFYDNNMNILEVSINILLDHEEASIVRENVGVLLGNLISHTVSSADDNLSLIVNLAQKDNTSVDSVFLLLDECNFYKELEKILSCLYLKTSFYYDSNNVIEKDDVASTYFKSKDEYTYAYMRNINEVSVRSLSSSGTRSGANYPIVTTPGLVKAVTVLLNNLMPLAYDYVVSCLQENGLIKMFFRTLGNPAMEITNTKELGLYCDILEMNTAICQLLSKAVEASHICLSTVLHTRDCLNVLLSLLDPSVYHTALSQLMYLRNRLWIEVFGLIRSLLESNCYEQLEKSSSTCLRTAETVHIISTTLRECNNYQPFLQTLCEAMSSNSSQELQNSALSSLTSLLKVGASQTNLEDTQDKGTDSIHNILDFVKTPRSLCEESLDENLVKLDLKIKSSQDESLNKKKSKMKLLENVYFGNMRNSNINYNVGKKLSFKPQSDVNKTMEDSLQSEPLMAGAELCKILLHLYDISNLKTGAQLSINRKKAMVISTLTSVLCVSHEAKKFALDNGLLEVIINQLKEAHIKLSLESVDCLRRVADKKRVCPLLKELNSVIGLLTNFLIGDYKTKSTAAAYGLADLCHKLWIWFNVQKTLLVDVMKMLCTFTTNCNTACQSLPLTSSVAGTGPRKVASNLSLLHAIFALVGKEMEQVSKTHDLTTLELSFHLLRNACTTVECRIIIAKSSLFQYLSRLHPALTKKQKPWESVELLWLNFLQTFTGYPEGQACTTKVADVLELIITLAFGTKTTNKHVAMDVLRNIAFYPSNRSRLLTSDDFINLLRTKITTGTIEEKNIVVLIMWALAANNQKAKLVLKCAGLDSKLKELLKVMQVSEEEKVQPEDLSRMHYVLNLLKDGDKSS